MNLLDFIEGRLVTAMIVESCGALVGRASITITWCQLDDTARITSWEQSHEYGVPSGSTDERDLAIYTIANAIVNLVVSIVPGDARAELMQERFLLLGRHA